MLKTCRNTFIKTILLLGGILLCVVTCKPQKNQNADNQTRPASLASQPKLCTGLAPTTGIDALPTPSFRESIGTSSLRIYTQNILAQKWFHQGLNLLHGFWHLEAYRAFSQVVKLDSACAMGYWGLAMCQPGFGSADSRWVNAINKAAALKSTASPLEQQLISACQILLLQGPDAALQPFRALANHYPNQPEAVAFAAIMMRQTNNDMTGPVGNEIKTMLEKAMRQFPQNTALMHYYVHLMELRPDFGLARRWPKN